MKNVEDELKLSLRIAWLKTGKPGDGWEIWEDCQNSDRKPTQQQIALMYEVAPSTSYLWHKKYKTMKEVV